jgi:hypothetical protein
MKAFTYSLIHVLIFCALPDFFVRFSADIKLHTKLYNGFETFYMEMFFVLKKFFA